MQVCSRLGLLDLFRLLFFTLVHEAIRVILLVPARITFTHIYSSVSENLDSPLVARISAALEIQLHFPWNSSTDLHCISFNFQIFNF